MLHNKIYALCDYELLKKYNISFSQYIEKISKYNIIYIQYRDKTNSLTTKKTNLLTLKSLTKIPIIINDNIELLDIADGLHLGQEDIIELKKKFNIDSTQLLFTILRKKYKNKIFGISTHNEFEILEANKLDIDYIGLGAYRDTSTKQDISSILGKKISYLAKISTHPVGAIGGVKKDDNIPNITYYVIGSDLLL